MFLSKERLKAALTDLHEIVFDDPLLEGAVLLRELSAAQRLMVNEAAVREDGTIDNYLYRAMLLQMMIVDPDSGQPYADGREGIDPRTRKPLFDSDEVIELFEGGREIVMTKLLDAGLQLSRLSPADFRSRNATANTPEPSAGQGAEVDAPNLRDNARSESGPADKRETHDGEPSQDGGGQSGDVS
jgi:hypothetical protein